MALKLTLASIRPGATHGADFDATVGDYLKRCGRYLPSTARVFRTEKLFLDWVNIERGDALAFWIADLDGTVCTTEQFARRVGDLRDGGTRHLVVAIGPADGWADSTRAVANMRLSLSAMTLPHELARLILAEQIYRAVTILQGHPYHTGH
jgi:23S rRNA (pseudouridine1915-N3)-methyltransferase